MSMYAQVHQSLTWDRFVRGDTHVCPLDTAEQLERQSACKILHKWDDSKEKLAPDGAGAWKVVPLKG
jgi:hypothetical protein